MSGGYLWAWYATGSKWVKVQANVDGEMLIDPTAILENPPTEDEALKAPTSEWAFDHDADVAAHHAKYTDAAALAIAAGEGHITILPWNYNTLGQGTWSFVALAGQVMGLLFRNSSGVNGDNITFKAFLAQGTYTLRVLHFLGTTAGIADIYIDAAEVGSFDGYAAVSTYNQIYTETEIVVASSGLKTIKVIADGKHASATSWAMYITSLTFWRTA